MPHSGRSGFWLFVTIVVAVILSGVSGARAGAGQAGGAQAPIPVKNTMASPYELVENWPHLGPGMKWGAAIGLIPDGKGGAWMHFRSEPPIIHFNAAGTILKSFGDGMFQQAHGFCQDRDGNFWAGDSGPFGDDPKAVGKGFVMHKFSPDGKLLMTIGKPGVSKAGTDTFIGPTSCVIAANGDLMIGDGHIPRPSSAQQDGDRIVRYTTAGKFVQQWGKQGTNLGEFWGPHALAYDSQGRLFVADRSNNRIQIFDKDMNVVDDWKQFGRPSGVWILKDDTLIVSDSESSYTGFRPTEVGPAPAPASAPASGPSARNAGWKNGIRIGSAKDGSLKYFIANTRPEGLTADELGNIFAGLTSGCEFSKSGGCLQKYVKRPASRGSSNSK